MTSIDLHDLVRTLEGRGVTLEPKPDGGVRLNAPRPLEPELLEAIKANKAALLEMLPPQNPSRTTIATKDKQSQPATILGNPKVQVAALEPLPLELRALVLSASSGVLPKGAVSLGTGLTLDLERYVLGFAAQYLTGDQAHALRELHECQTVWQVLTRKAVNA